MDYGQTEPRADSFFTERRYAGAAISCCRRVSVRQSFRLSGCLSARLSVTSLYCIKTTVRIFGVEAPFHPSYTLCRKKIRVSTIDAKLYTALFHHKMVAKTE